MSEEVFWSLSWYEWGLHILRLEREAYLRKLTSQDHWAQTREIWAVLINQWRAKGTPTITPDKLIRLSLFDKEAVEETEVVNTPPEEAFKKFGPLMKRDNAK